MNQQKIRLGIVSLKRLNTFIECSCGCSTIITKYDQWHRLRRSIKGHRHSGKTLETLELENREMTRLWRIKNKQQVLDYAKKYKKLHKKDYAQKRALEKFQVFIYYCDGVPQCACCGELELKFLTLDHINNDGAEHRRKVGKEQIFRWIIKNNFPSGFQILCFNCNCARQYNKICPHKQHREEEKRIEFRLT